VKRDAWNRCCECGKFVSYQDILDGKATHILVTPESLVTRETFETLCRKHAAHASQNRRSGHGGN
jgi:hypothetical protein